MELLRSGNHLQKPTECPKKVYDLMAKTWDLDPQERPTWAAIVEETRRLFTSKSD
jgi:hypothetical protein